MKNNYVLWSIFFGCLSNLAFSQNTYVTGTAKVKVEPNTLVYFGEDLNLTSAVNAASVIENAGNVKIDGNFVNQETSLNGTNFVTTWTSLNNYGQVIVKDNKTAGKLGMEKGTISPAAFNWGQFAIPFSFATAEDAMQALFNKAYVNGGNRYYASMMKWDNSGKPEFDHLNKTSPITPGDYIILNLEYYSPGIKVLMENNAKLLYKGAPTNQTYNVTWNNNLYPTTAWTVWGATKNSYNEKYNTYLDDKVRSMPADDATFAKYYYEFGNPYTSNIDLAYIGTNSGYDDGVYIDNLGGVVKLSDQTWTLLSGSSYGNVVKATYDSGTNTWAGQKEALIIKPFEPFQLMLNADTGTSGFQFTDKMKTFSMDPRSGITVNPFGKFGTEGEGGTGFYQLGLNLYSAAGDLTSNRVYVAVSPIASAGESNVLEAEYSDFGDRTGFYLGQENPEGLPVKSSVRKMDINTINPDFVNKSIPLFFNREAGDNNGYYLKADLFFGDIFNQLNLEDVNFADGNSFFFYDDKQDIMLPVTTDFNYYIEPEDVYGSKIRYELYWNGVPDKDMSVDDQFASSTIIYKDQDLHKVKFNPNWTTAEVKVFDISGRNIQSFSNVNTKNEFSLNLPRGVYVVRIKSNTDQVYTQKIIK